MLCCPRCTRLFSYSTAPTSTHSSSLRHGLRPPPSRPQTPSLSLLMVSVGLLQPACLLALCYRFADTAMAEGAMKNRIIVCSKTDLRVKKAVDRQSAKDFCRRVGCSYLEQCSNSSEGRDKLLQVPRFCNLSWPTSSPKCFFSMFAAFLFNFSFFVNQSKQFPPHCLSNAAHSYWPLRSDSHCRASSIIPAPAPPAERAPASSKA